MRVRRLLGVVLVLMTIALPALAQEGGVQGDESTEAVNALVTVGFLALVIQYAIEWVRGRAPNLDSDIVRAVAILLGYGAAWLWDLDVAGDFGFEGLPLALSYLVAALVIAGLAGFLGSAKNALRARDPNSTLHEHTI